MVNARKIPTSQRRNAIYNAVTVEQVNAAAKKYLHPSTGVLVIAGATPQ